jgi:hypothetical protein
VTVDPGPLYDPPGRSDRMIVEIRPLRPADAEQAFQLRVNAFSPSTRGDYDADEIYAPDEHRLVAVDRGR